MMVDQVVYIVDDDESVRDAVSEFFIEHGLTVQTFPSAEAFLPHVDEEMAGCLVLDVCLPGMSGLELLERLAETRCGLPVIMITGYGDVASAVRAMRGGACDFIEKPFSHYLLLENVQRCLVADRENSRCRAIRREAREKLERLTPREGEILDKLVEGKINKQIAVELDISVRTVEVHRSRIMVKLEVGSLSEMVRLALLARSTEYPQES